MQTKWVVEVINSITLREQMGEVRPGVAGQKGKSTADVSGDFGWFTEGFDTADLREARALLEAWAL